MDNDSNLYDPLLHDIDLPLSGTFYALGFWVEIATNSQLVLDAAAESWGTYRAEFASQPVELRIVVQPGETIGPRPQVRTQKHYFSVVGDQENFGVYDSATFFGYCFVSEATAGDSACFRFYYLETMVYMLLAQRYVMPVHAACIEKDGVGVMLYGLSGAGKSTLAWACARAGWTYVTDDGAWLLPEAGDGAVIGHSRQIHFKLDAPELFPELDRYAWRTRPSGKLTLEIELTYFPEIRTSWRSRVQRVVVLSRDSAVNARVEPIPGEEVAALLLNDMPRYEPAVRVRYQEVVGRLVKAPCCRLIYHDLAIAVQLLEGVAAGQF